MSKFCQHPAGAGIKNQWGTRAKDRSLPLEQVKERKELKKLRKKRRKGR